MNVAYLSQGKLFVKEGESASRQIESHFGQEVVKRALRMQQRNEWKTRKQGTPFGGSMLWGVQNGDPRATQVSISGVTRSAEENALLFTLDMETTGGLFLYDYKDANERRLFHKEQFRARDLDRHPESHHLVASQSFENGTANIITMDAEGRDLRYLTEGDSVDEAPSWVPGSAGRILFQSAGVARNQQGFFMGTGPFEIQELDLERKSHKTILEDPHYDFLLPQADAEGNLYFIRRPYEPLGQSRYGIFQGALDFLLLPFRLLRALFHFLNFFSMTFSQKPLTTASGPKVEGDDEKTLSLRGKMIDVQKALREADKTKEPASLVPKTWELVQRSSGGTEKVLSKNVVSFDVAKDGALIYTNGSAIYQLTPDGKRRQVVKGHLIEHVMLID